MRKLFGKVGLGMLVVMVLVGCAKDGELNNKNEMARLLENAVKIELSDEVIMVDGKEISSMEESAVYKANDIVYYEEGHDFTYGEGEKKDEHSKEEADKHTVVHITKPGTYSVSGQLSYGQIAVDLGDGAKKDEEAIVNLILNGIDINCDVAPAVIFYNVYECGSDEVEDASQNVDTSNAGANVYIADDTENNVNGSYVARIYKSVELNEEGTKVVDSKKLHKYDAAFYSKRTLNINGGEKGNGILNIVAENEGLDSELHLTINGGNINIESGNDGINTNEDEVSVTCINGGTLNILVNGATGEGDGIDSNGWLVINGGTVISAACSTSMDAGIDSDMGIHINGGTVIATGNMLDRIGDSDQTYVIFSYAERQNGGNIYTLKNASDEEVFRFENINEFTYLLVADKKLTEGDYTLWCNDLLSEGSSNASFGMGSGGFFGGKPDENWTPDENWKPDEMPKPEIGYMQAEGEKSSVFTIKKGINQFSNINVASVTEDK